MRIRPYNFLRHPEPEATGGTGGAGAGAGAGGSFISSPDGGGAGKNRQENPNPGDAPAQGGGKPSGTPDPNPNPTGDGASDWRASLPKELQEDASLGKFTSIEALAGAYVNAQKLIGKTKIPVPDTSTTPEQWQEIYDRLGRPSLDKYEVKFPEGTGIDEEFTKEFREQAHKAGLLPHQAKELATWFGTANAQVELELQQELSKKFEKDQQALRAEWGEAYQMKIGKANHLIKEFGGEEFMKTIQQAGLDRSGEFFRFLAKVADKTMGEGEYKGPGQDGVTPQDLLKQIRELEADPAYFDRNHARHKTVKEEVTALYDRLYVDKK